MRTPLAYLPLATRILTIIPRIGYKYAKTSFQVTQNPSMEQISHAASERNSIPYLDPKIISTMQLASSIALSLLTPAFSALDQGNTKAVDVPASWKQNWTTFDKSTSNVNMPSDPFIYYFVVPDKEIE